MRRPRPQGFRLVEAPGLSFPSGHSMAAMAFYGYGIWLVRCCVCGLPFGAAIEVALACVILAVGVSRVYLGVHYVSGCAGLVLPVFCLAHPVRASWPLDFDRLIVATGRHVGSRSDFNAALKSAKQLGKARFVA